MLSKRTRNGYAGHKFFWLHSTVTLSLLISCGHFSDVKHSIYHEKHDFGVQPNFEGEFASIFVENWPMAWLVLLSLKKMSKYNNKECSFPLIILEIDRENHGTNE